MAGNTATSGAGIQGGEFDQLTMRNTIVAKNQGAPSEIDGFSHRDVKSSLLCPPGAAQDGVRDADANFCADPLLVDAQGGEVHETANSPSRNAGDDSLVPSDLTKDYEGDGRIGENRVDVGADEFVPAPPRTETTTPPATTTPTPPQQQGVAAVKARSCVSRRGFRIRLRVPHGQKASSAVVRVVSTKVKITVRGKRLTAPVLLRGLPKGEFSVKITIHPKNGKSVTGTRTYHTCAKKKTGTVPEI